MGLARHGPATEYKTTRSRAVRDAAGQIRRRFDAYYAIAQEKAEAGYQKYIIEGLLRQKPLKPSKDGRHVPLRVGDDTPLVDERRDGPFISNTIRTSRYTVYDFVPKQLVFQFTRLSNFYFLCVGIPQMIPGLSTTGSYTTIVPLMFFVALTMFKEGYDDYRRHRLDKLENANEVVVLRKQGTGEDSKVSWFDSLLRRRKRRHPLSRGNLEAASEGARSIDASAGDCSWMRVQWRDVKVGDVIQLSRDDEVPADFILLHATGENGMAYVDTMALDGETNLKNKQTSPVFGECSSASAIQSCRAELVLEDPNPDLYRFDGRVAVDGKVSPLTLNEVVYRGSVIRNTLRAIGIVVNTGEECKLRMNANQHPKAKIPALESISNKIVLGLAIYMVLLSVGCSMGYIKWHRDTERQAWYLTDAAVPFKEIIFGFFIMFNNVIPLALFVTLEIIKIGQALMLNIDRAMYDEATDTPARCNTNTILENLGQVSHVFSDKTGTLTENLMKFRKMTIAGKAWLHEMDLQDDPEVMSKLSKTHIGHDTSDDTLSSARDVLETEEPSVRFPVSISVSPPAYTHQASDLGRRSSSHWRSESHPEHIQPEFNTVDLLEYMSLRQASPYAQKARDFLLSMALCHTCLPEMKNGEIEFESSSPDEVALVRAAKELGFLVTHRSSQSLTMKTTSQGGKEIEETYEILDVIEFSSKRKRMSIVVRYPDGRVCIICKGADSAILPRLKLSNLAQQKATEVRKSVDLEHELLRRSEQNDPRVSIGGRASVTLARRSFAVARPVASSGNRPAIERSRSAEISRKSISEKTAKLAPGIRTASLDISKTLRPPGGNVGHPLARGDKFDFLDDPVINDDSAIFTQCFKHLNDFATEGLRTLLFVRRFIPEQEYQKWKCTYDEATTSLVDRQEMIEATADLIEQSFDLVGASAIEDKLQDGVPETIDKLHRAHIKIWMLTGDKRETAINIAHAARICRPTSDTFVLDDSKGSLSAQITHIEEGIKTGCRHSVVVVDGHTLGIIEASSSLTKLFYTLIPTVNSVICCRASPAQKASLVRAIRREQPEALTLAIGDGANDLAMISTSHVGVGISGKEGLQAARVADYAIAQFRFLQRLLLVHGRWNYLRTAKFILANFWKEMFFYLPTTLYQRTNGYTGTSLYESWSLTILNVIFTSLCLIIPGIFEQDLSATTLLAVPELYRFGQLNKGLNARKALAWLAAGAVEGVVVYWVVYFGYGGIWGEVADRGLFAFGDLAFGIGVTWINIKLFLIEAHHKTSFILAGFILAFGGWWIWQAFLAHAYPDAISPYHARDGFTEHFGRDGQWWLTFVVALAMLFGVEVMYKAVEWQLVVSGLWKWPTVGGWSRRGGKRGPGDAVHVVGGDGVGWDETEEGEKEEVWNVQLWQELEKDPKVMRRLAGLDLDGEGVGGEEESAEDI